MGAEPYQPISGGAAMSGADWPKESQRMCNGASGQVPVTSINGDTFELPAHLQKEADIAIDVADHMAEQSLDYARSRLGPDWKNAVPLAAAHLNCAIVVLSTRMRDAALRELTPEIAGAISEAGTDIGAGIALALEQALKTFPDDNTHNG